MHAQYWLSDFDCDQALLAYQGVSLLIFTSAFCGSCHYARARLPQLELPIERLCWVDAGENGGLVARYEVFHLPTLFVIRDGYIYGTLNSALEQEQLTQAINALLDQPAQELP